jgi:NADH:ubiquinone oxidoreductase subunit K
MITLSHVLLTSAALFCLGLAIVLLRRNAIIMLIGIEFMLAAANLNFIAFWRFGEGSASLTAPLFAIFAIPVAAGAVAVGLALIILLYRHRRTIDPVKLTDSDHES